MIEHTQLRRESRCFLLPVEDQRARHNHQGGPRTVGWPSSAQGPPGFEQSEHLHGLAEPHVVGQAATESELLQKVEPTQSLALVAAQLADKSSRCLGRANSLKVKELVACLLKYRVAARFGL